MTTPRVPSTIEATLAGLVQPCLARPWPPPDSFVAAGVASTTVMDTRFPTLPS
jgi:hypothetical protein